MFSDDDGHDLDSEDQGNVCVCDDGDASGGGGGDDGGGGGVGDDGGDDDGDGGGGGGGDAVGIDCRHNILILQ